MWPLKQIYWFGILTIAYIIAYWIPLSGIVNTWATNDDYSYGYLIPVISVYLFWDMRDRLKGLVIQPEWRVFPLLLLFLMISVYGILGSSGNISRPAVPIVFILFFAFIFGIGAFRRFWLPLSFLIFMVPLPAILDRTLGVFLKSVSSLLGGALIRLSGLSVHVSGNVIDLGVTQLQVVDACSGLRFLFPLLAIGVLYAYFFEKVRWKQFFCVVATIPIAIITNGLRIGVTGILTHYIGPEVAEGFFHDFSGWAIFMLAAVFLFAFGRIVRFLPPKGIQQKASDPYTDDSSNKDAINQKNCFAFTVSLTLVSIVGLLSITTGALPAIKLKNGIAAFPSIIEEWAGNSQRLDPIITEQSGADEAFFAHYQNTDKKMVSLYIGYRSTSFLENENFFHSPTVCLPSSGWKELERSTYIINDVPEFDDFKVTRMLVEQMGTRQLVYFWFQTKTRATHNKNINRFHLTLHALTRDNTHDMFLRTITPVSTHESPDEAGRRMDGFIRDTVEVIVQFINDNAHEDV